MMQPARILIKEGYSRTPQTMPNVNWPKPIPHEKWCPAFKEIGKCACDAGRINDMLSDCKEAVGEAQVKHKCQVCDKEAVVDQKTNGWRCQDHVLFGEAQPSSELKPGTTDWNKGGKLAVNYLNEARPEGLVPSHLEPPDYETPLNRAFLINKISDWYDKKFEGKKGYQKVSVFDLIADFIVNTKYGTPALPSVEEIERIISFSDLWVTHPQRPQGHKRHLAQAIHERLMREGK